jgi:hypothetical protein
VSERELLAPLAELTASAPTTGSVDERWYWAAADAAGRVRSAPSNDDSLVAGIPTSWHGGRRRARQAGGPRLPREHLEHASKLLEDPSSSDVVPDDLDLAVTARLALAGPGRPPCVPCVGSPPSCR